MAAESSPQEQIDNLKRLLIDQMPENCKRCVVARALACTVAARIIGKIETTSIESCLSNFSEFTNLCTEGVHETGGCGTDQPGRLECRHPFLPDRYSQRDSYTNSNDKKFEDIVNGPSDLC